MQIISFFQVKEFFNDLAGIIINYIPISILKLEIQLKDMVVNDEKLIVV